MDRNYKERPGQKARPVALRKESVDRNPIVPVELTTLVNVALRKESVDRNVTAFDVLAISAVALRKESVDRNFESRSTYYSPPPVALRKESVDRNASSGVDFAEDWRRSPQGERG